MMSLFFVGNAMGQAAPVKTKEKDDGSGNPTKYCSYSKYTIGQKLEHNTIFPFKVIVNRIDYEEGVSAHRGGRPRVFIDERTGTTPEELYDEIDYNTGYATFVTNMKIRCSCDQAWAQDCYYPKLMYSEIEVISFYASDGDTTSITTISDYNSQNKITAHEVTPNPINQLGYIKYTIEQEAQVSLIVYDMSGNIIEVLLDNIDQTSGSYRMFFSLIGKPKGLYTYRIIADNFTKTGIIVKE